MDFVIAYEMIWCVGKYTSRDNRSGWTLYCMILIWGVLQGSGLNAALWHDQQVIHQAYGAGWHCTVTHISSYGVSYWVMICTLLDLSVGEGRPCQGDPLIPYSKPISARLIGPKQISSTDQAFASYAMAYCLSMSWYFWKQLEIVLPGIMTFKHCFDESGLSISIKYISYTVHPGHTVKCKELYYQL